MDDGFESATSAAEPAEPPRPTVTSGQTVTTGQIVGDLDRLRDELLRIAAVVLPSQEDRT